MVMDEKTGVGAPKPQRKMKFMPKAPPRREQKLILPKPEKVVEAEADDVKGARIDEALQRKFSHEASYRPKFKAEIKPSQTRVSSFNFGPSGPKPGGIGMKEYKEPWYYPVTLPVRMPYSGNPELLDEQEFMEGSVTNAYNESSSKPAEELGLMEEDLEKKLIFIQLPPTMPVPKQSTKIDGGSSSKPLKYRKRLQSE